MAAVLVAALPLAAGAASPGPVGRIVLITIDTLRYDYIAANGNDFIRTPNLDKLASQGMRFTDAHSSSGVCSPSRYTLLTGRYHWRTRLQAGIVGKWGLGEAGTNGMAGEIIFTMKMLMTAWRVSCQN